MAAFDAGSIEARLELDRSNFDAGIERAKAEGKQLEGQQFNASLGANAEQVTAAVKKAQGELDSLKGQRSDVLIGGNNAELDRQISEAEKKLDELKRKEAEVGTEGEGSFRKVSEAIGKMHESLDKTIGRTDELRGRMVEAMEGARGGAERAAGAMEHYAASTGHAHRLTTDFGAAVQDAAGKIPLMVVGGAALASALLPPLGLATEAALGMAGALTIAGIGFGSLGILASPILGSIKNDMTALGPLTKAWQAAQPGPKEVQAWNALQFVIGKLPDGERQVVQGIFDLKAQMRDLSDQIKPNLLGAFSQWLGAAHDLLPQLVAPAKATADAMGVLGGHLRDDFNSPGFHLFMSWATNQMGSVIEGIGHAVGELAAGFGHLLMDSTPLIGSFVNGLQHITTEFNHWADNKGSAEIQKLMNFVRQNGPEMRRVLDDVALAVANVGHALAQMSGLNLQVLDFLAQSISFIAKIPGIGPVVADIGLLALALAKFGVLGPVVSILQRLGTYLFDTITGVKAVGPEIAAAGVRIEEGGAAAVQGGNLFRSAGGVAAEGSAGFQAEATAAEAAAAQIRLAGGSAVEAEGALGAGGIGGAAKTAGGEAEAAGGRFAGLAGSLTGLLVPAMAAAGLALVGWEIGQFRVKQGMDAYNQTQDQNKQLIQGALPSYADFEKKLGDVDGQLIALHGHGLSNNSVVARFQELTNGARLAAQGHATALAGVSGQMIQAESNAANMGQAFGVSQEVIFRAAQSIGFSIKDLGDKSKNAQVAVAVSMDGIEQAIGRLPPALANDANQAMAGLTQAIQRGQAPGAASQSAAAIEDAYQKLNAIPGMGQQVMNLLKTTIFSYGDQINAGTRHSVDDLISNYQRLPPPVQEAARAAMEELNAGLATGNQDAINDATTKLNDLEAHYQAVVAPIGQRGTDAGVQFATNINNQMNNGLNTLQGIMAAYDAALAAGISPILVGVGGQSIHAPYAPPTGPPGGAQFPHGLATGGLMVDHPMFLVGEETPQHKEIVLTENPAYRTRNLDLFKKAGKMLNIPGFQQGGFTSGAQVPPPPSHDLLLHGSVPESFGSATNQAATFEYNKVKAWVDAQAAAAAAVSSAGGSPFGGGPVKAYMLGEVAKRWPGEAQAAAFDFVESHEAGYNPNAANPSSNARGLAQKISGWSADYQPGNVQQQTAWMLNYIAGRYGDPLGAAAFWRAHNWYGDGGIFTKPTIIGVGEKGPEAVVPLSPDSGMFHPGLGTGPGGGYSFAPSTQIIVQGDLTRESVKPLSDSLAARDQALLSELSARGWSPNRLPGAG